MVGRWWMLCVAGTAWLAVNCGGKSSTSELPGRTSGFAGNSGGAGVGSGGTSTQAGSGAEPSVGGDGGVGGVEFLPCEAGDMRCNSSGVRELCASDGWKPTDFSCARNVTVDDDVGSYCITKTDGTYRCWGDNPAPALPAERYQQVQLARQGLIGLTKDGRLMARGTNLPPEFQPVGSFSATNMFGTYGVCAVIADGSFQILMQDTFDGTISTRKVEGPFASAFCAFEGMAAGVLADGGLWTLMPNDPPLGRDFEEVAFSFGVFCARTRGGAVACFAPPSAGGALAGQSCADTRACPIFPAGRYRSITATGTVACAIDEMGALICKRHDGVDMPSVSGRYTLAKGGLDVLCAIRIDGSVACFRHGGGGFVSDDIGPFASVEPITDPAW